MGRGAPCGRQTLGLQLFGRKARIPAQLLPRGTVVWHLTSGPSAAGSWGCLSLLQLQCQLGARAGTEEAPSMGSRREHHCAIPASHVLSAPLCSSLCSVTMSDSASLWTVALQAPFHGIIQARILEWVSICFSRGSSQPRN